MGTQTFSVDAAHLRSLAHEYKMASEDETRSTRERLYLNQACTNMLRALLCIESAQIIAETEAEAEHV